MSALRLLCIIALSCCIGNSVSSNIDQARAELEAARAKLEAAQRADSPSLGNKLEHARAEMKSELKKQLEQVQADLKKTTEEAMSESRQTPGETDSENLLLKQQLEEAQANAERAAKASEQESKRQTEAIEAKNEELRQELARVQAELQKQASEAEAYTKKTARGTIAALNKMEALQAEAQKAKKMHVTKEEFIAKLSGTKSKSEALALFSMMDANQNDEICPHEFLVFYKPQLQSNSPGSSGSWFNTIALLVHMLATMGAVHMGVGPLIQGKATHEMLAAKFGWLAVFGSTAIFPFLVLYRWILADNVLLRQALGRTFTLKMEYLFPKEEGTDFVLNKLVKSKTHFTDSLPGRAMIAYTDGDKWYESVFGNISIMDLDVIEEGHHWQLSFNEWTTWTVGTGSTVDIRFEDGRQTVEFNIKYQMQPFSLALMAVLGAAVKINTQHVNAFLKPLGSELHQCKDSKGSSPPADIAAY